MGIGFRELIALFVLLALVCAFIVFIIWFANRGRKHSPAPGRQRSASERLAELESLRQGGQISDAEYEQQRAAIISSV